MSRLLTRRISRRQVLQASGAVGAVALLSKPNWLRYAYADALPGAENFQFNADIVSPASRPFVEPLPIAQPLQPVAPFAPVPPPEAPGGQFQFFERFPPVDFYRLVERQVMHSYHRDFPTTPGVWAYGGTVPCPVLVWRYGRPVLVRFVNELPANHRGFGIPEVITHIHNFHSASESDGFPNDFFGPGQARDHHYTMAYAGFTQPQFGALGDPREALGTDWYHDHRADFTAQNAYRGLAGGTVFYDALDSGNETDPPPALGLPSGEFDVYLNLEDKAFLPNGELYFDPLNFNGFLGDKFIVNGKVQPFLQVARRKYRFRLNSANVARYWDIWLAKGTRFLPFDYQIATDGFLLDRPAPNVQNVVLAPAKRADLIIDFSRFQIGDQLFLVNRLQQQKEKRARPDADRVSPGLPFLRFDVVRDAPDRSRVPATLRPFPPIDLREVVARREFVFNRNNGQWAINNKLWDGGAVPSVLIKRNTAEIWKLKNGGGGWSHPIHIHLESFRVLTRNGKPPTDIFDRGRQDSVNLGPGDEVEIFMRFRDFLGRYVWHCHNTQHEDHAMMLRFDLVP